MECNKDEAERVKEIAEKKFLANDVNGTKKFALKAQKLYPHLDSIAQMVMTLDVSVAAEEGKINGESNWYGVLGVSNLADDEVIRKQFRKLALLLHPDKNKSVGANGAFQLVSQASSLLLDKAKRIAYDQKFGKAFGQKKDTKSEGPPPSAKLNAFPSSTKTSASQMGVPFANYEKKDAASDPSKFQTLCWHCMRLLLYYRIYLNDKVRCYHCNEDFLAVEIELPSSRGFKAPNQTSGSQHQEGTNKHEPVGPQNCSTTPCSKTSRFSGSNDINNSNFCRAPSSKSTSSAYAVHTENVARRIFAKVKQDSQKSPAVTTKEDILRREAPASKRTTGTEPRGHSCAGKRRKEVTNAYSTNCTPPTPPILKGQGATRKVTRKKIPDELQSKVTRKGNSSGTSHDNGSCKNHSSKLQSKSHFRYWWTETPVGHPAGKKNISGSAHGEQTSHRVEAVHSTEPNQE